MNILYKKVLFVVTILVTLTIGSVSGTTYYVNSSTGSDGNSTAQAQSSSTPWLTLGHALSTCSSGDVINVGGTANYSDKTISCALASITIQNTSGATPVFDGGSSSYFIK